VRVCVRACLRVCVCACVCVRACVRVCVCRIKGHQGVALNDLVYIMTHTKHVCRVQLVQSLPAMVVCVCACRIEGHQGVAMDDLVYIMTHTKHVCRVQLVQSLPAMVVCVSVRAGLRGTRVWPWMTWCTLRPTQNMSVVCSLYKVCQLWLCACLCVQD